MPSSGAERIIDNAMRGMENYYGCEFPKRSGYIRIYAEQIDQPLQLIRNDIHDRMFAAQEAHNEEIEANGDTELAFSLKEEAEWLAGMLQKIETQLSAQESPPASAQEKEQ